MSGLRPIGEILADLLPKLAARLHRFDIASTATSEALETNGIRPRMFSAEISGDSRDRGAA